MNGKRVRMLRLFDGDLASGRVVIAALDHGMFQGVQPGLERMDEALANGMEADAILTGPAMIERCADVVAPGGAGPHRAGPASPPRTASRGTTTRATPGRCFDPSYLLSMGAEIVVSSLQLRTGSERIDAENAEVWGRVVVEKERLGRAADRGVPPDGVRERGQGRVARPGEERLPDPLRAGRGHDQDVLHRRTVLGDRGSGAGPDLRPRLQKAAPGTRRPGPRGDARSGGGARGVGDRAEHLPGAEPRERWSAR